MNTTVAPTTSFAVLSDKDRDNAQRYLAETCDAVERAVAQLDAAQWRFRQSPDRWSIADVVEHLAVVEEFFLRRVVPRLETAEPVVAPDVNKDVQVIELEPDPAVTTVEPGRPSLGRAPSQIEPTGRWEPRDSLARFLSSRRQTADVLRTSTHLRGGAIEHPAFGPLDGYQWVLFVAAHAARHVKQISGITADPRFPQ